MGTPACLQLEQVADVARISVAMDDLTPNPKGCSEFDPHPFKKEKCRSCGRPWHEHKGAISEQHLQPFLKAKADAENKRLQEEAAAKAKARAKALAKKKASRSAEDEWFFDDADDDAESEDDQLGFQMLGGGDAKSTTATTAVTPVEKEVGKPMKIVNLIDFGECDVKEESSTESGGEPMGSQLPAPLDQHEQSDIASSAGPESAAALSGPGPQEVELMEELELLRQRLKDSDAERDVLVSIVQDEVAEKQRVIDDLMRQRKETEEKLKSTQESVEALTRQKEEAVRASVTAEAAASAAAAQAAEAVAAADAATAALAAAKRQQEEDAATAAMAAAKRQQEEEERARSPGPLRQSAALAEPNQEGKAQADSTPAQLQVQHANTDSLPMRLLNPRVWTKCLRPPE